MRIFKIFLVLLVFIFCACGCTNKNKMTNNPLQKELKSKYTRIPSWVYDNSSEEDEYYQLISSNKKSILLIDTDCPIGRSNKEMIKRVITLTPASKNFNTYVILKPEGSVTIPDCHKIYENISYPSEEFTNTVKERQGNGDRHAILNIGDGRYCIPYVKNGNLPDGACNCVVNYILENCSKQICFINPIKREIEIIKPEEDIFTNKIQELENW